MHTRFSSRTSLRLGGLALTSLVLTELAPVAAQAQAYTLTELGTLAGPNNPAASNGYGVNDSGQVTGTSQTDSHVPPQPFLSDPNGGALHALGTGFSTAYGVNDSGQVVGGTGLLSQPIEAEAFLSDPNGGDLHDLGVLSGTTGASAGFGVNASGQVTGSASTASGVSHAFLSGPNGAALTAANDLGTLSGDTFSEGLGVNASGQVTGVSNNAGGADPHAFLSGPNGVGLTDLGTLPGDISSEGLGVNASGQVVGYSENASGDKHAFVSGPNGVGLTDLGPGIATAINDSGQVVGSFGTGPSLYSNGVITNLSTLFTPVSGFVLGGATGISNTGFITGTGSNLRFGLGPEPEAYLLTPAVPEASSVISLGLLLALGLGGLIVTRRKRTA